VVPLVGRGVGEFELDRRGFDADSRSSSIGWPCSKRVVVLDDGEALCFGFFFRASESSESSSMSESEESESLSESLSESTGGATIPL